MILLVGAGPERARSPQVPGVRADHPHGGTSSITIDFCPWCGRRLPESQRDRWFDELERRGIDPWEDEVPAEFQDDGWLAAMPQE
ncbi:DUF6980 family protein [Streptomyces sp. WAC01280]|uniref:DUF6980 family protein n=1 Tax=Streptomyces sp. WAC01280 TaxID=2487424 RepID=UPI0037DCE1A0